MDASGASAAFEEELRKVEIVIKGALLVFAQAVRRLCEEKGEPESAFRIEDAHDALLKRFSNDNSFEKVISHIFAQIPASNLTEEIGNGNSYPLKASDLEMDAEIVQMEIHEDSENEQDQILSRFPSGSDTGDIEYEHDDQDVTLNKQDNTCLSSEPQNEAVERPIFVNDRKLSNSATSGRLLETQESATIAMNAAIKVVCHKKNIKLGRRSSIDIEQLTHIAIGIGSPIAIVQLFDALQTATGKDSHPESTVAFRNMDFVTLVHEVEHDDATDHTTNIVKRFQLHRMASLGHERKAFRLHEWQAKQTYPTEIEEKGLYSRKPIPQIQTKIACSAMKDLMREAYPTLEHDRAKRTKDQQAEYAKRWNSLRDILFRAERWYWLAERYTRGILPLIPSVGPSGISNESIELLTPEAFGVLLATLQETRGRFLTRLGSKLHSNVVDLLTGACTPMFVFKNMERRHLENASYDSKDLVTYCGSIIPSNALQRKESMPL